MVMLPLRQFVYVLGLNRFSLFDLARGGGTEDPCDLSVPDAPEIEYRRFPSALRLAALDHPSSLLNEHADQSQSKRQTLLQRRTASGRGYSSIQMVFLKTMMLPLSAVQLLVRLGLILIPRMIDKRGEAAPPYSPVQIRFARLAAACVVAPFIAH